MSIQNSGGSTRVWAYLRIVPLLCMLVAPLQSKAESKTLEDAKLYFTAPLRWESTDWIVFGSSVLAIGAAHHYDEDVRTHYAVGAKAALDGADPHDRRDYLPTLALVAGTLGYAALLRDPAGYREAWSLVEVAGLSGITGYALKYAAGRQRPNETTDPNAWHTGGDSFPSMHVNLAFAVGTVLAESGNDRYRWLRRTLGYGTAAVIAYNRMHDNAHWLSDTVAGAALGMGSARFILNRRGDAPNQSSLMLMPIDQGLMLSYSVPLH